MLSTAFENNQCAAESVGILPIFVHLAKINKQYEELMNILEIVCLKDPIILQHCHKIFTRFRLESYFGILLNKVIFLKN